MGRLMGGRGIASAYVQRRTILLTFAFVLFAVGCADTIAKQEEQALIRSPSGYGHDRKKIKEIQLILMYNDCDPGDVDGEMGPETREAIRKFQTSKNLPSSGYVDKETWSQMKNEGENGPSTVMDIQFALRKAGFFPGDVDGLWGSQTQNMIAEFQAAKRLKITRTVNPETWAVLKKHSPK